MAKEDRFMTTCPFRRKLTFLDSLHQVQAPLASIIENLHVAAEKEGIPLHKAFPTTKSFCDSRGFTDSQFEVCCQTKVKMPFELCTSIQDMMAITTPPPKEAFRSKLRCTDGISDADHSLFIQMWERLNCSTLLDLVSFYAIFDTTLYAG